MIEKILQKLLLESPAIRAEVGEGIWASYIPGATPQQPVIIIREISSESEYSLQNEIETVESIVQFDSYHESESRARKLDHLIRNKISGMLRRTVSWLDDGELRHDMIYAVIRTRGSAVPESPRDASDRWKHRYSTDYRIIYNHDAPTHT